MANITPILPGDLLTASLNAINTNFAALNAALAGASGDVTGGPGLVNVGRITKVSGAGAVTESIIAEASGRILIGATDNGVDKFQIAGTVLATTFKGNIDWSYLQNKPATFAPASHSHGDADLTALTWSKLTGVPVTFAPAAHSHAQSDVTGLATALADKASISGSYANPAWITSLAWSKLTEVPTTFAPAAHSHAQSEVTNLTTDLASKITTPDTTGAAGLYLRRNAANNGWEFGAGGTGGATSLTYSATAPTGNGNPGDLVFNSAPTAGGHVGWICLGGITWKRFGVIDL